MPDPLHSHLDHMSHELGPGLLKVVQNSGITFSSYPPILLLCSQGPRYTKLAEHSLDAVTAVQVLHKCDLVAAG